MADQMPKTLWAWIKRDDVPYASPMESEWSGNEPTGPMVYTKDLYLRADTCTPNEKCVSKAELEVFIRELEGLANPDTSSDEMDLAWGATTNSSLVRRDARATAYGIVAKRLREVMK